MRCIFLLLENKLMVYHGKGANNQINVDVYMDILIKPVGLCYIIMNGIIESRRTTNVIFN